MTIKPKCPHQICFFNFFNIIQQSCRLINTLCILIPKSYPVFPTTLIKCSCISSLVLLFMSINISFPSSEINSRIKVCKISAKQANNLLTVETFYKRCGRHILKSNHLNGWIFVLYLWEIPEYKISIKINTNLQIF